MLDIAKLLKIITQYTHLSILTGSQINDTHPLAFAAGTLGPNPNILNYDEAMKLLDADKFKDLMAEEMDTISKNKL